MTIGYTEQELASMSGPRPLKEIGSVEWCWQTVSALQHMWQSLHLNYEHYITILVEAEDEAIWEKIPPDTPYGSKVKMLAQVEVGDSKDAHKRMRIQTLAAQAKALQKRGRPVEDEKGYRDNVLCESGHSRNRGMSNDYLLARIARDHPEILQRVADGQFTSVRKAAREAGIALAQPKKTVTLSANVERVADTLKTHYSCEEVQRIIERLAESIEEARGDLSPAADA